VLWTILLVCDLESDMFDYISCKMTQHQRFVVRAKHERIVNAQGDTLSPCIESQSSVLFYEVKIQQKCGRKAHIAIVAVRYALVTISPPKKHKKICSTTLIVISCNEI